MKGHWSRFLSLRPLQSASSKWIKQSAEGAEPTRNPARDNPEMGKQRTLANLGLDEAPVAKLRTLGHHRTQIAARRRASGAKQSENAEHQLRVAAGRVEEGEGMQNSEGLQKEREHQLEYQVVECSARDVSRRTFALLQFRADNTVIGLQMRHQNTLNQPRWTEIQAEIVRELPTMPL